MVWFRRGGRGVGVGGGCSVLCAMWFATEAETVVLKCCFTSTETVCLLGTGAQDGHLDFDTAPEL